MSPIDVVVPCYNYARYLSACVESILSQQSVEVRVLIVDDCSPDDTSVVGKRLAADPRVEFSRNDVNQGLIATANRALFDLVSAPYTLLLSADDALTPGALARAIRVLDSHPEAGFVYGPAVVFDDDPPPTPVESNFDYRIIDGACLMEHICRHGNDLPSPTVVVRTALQREIGGYDPALPHTSDMEMWLRLSAYGKVAAIRPPQGYYRVHGQNMSAAYAAQPTRDSAERILAAERALASIGARVEGFAGWVNDLKRYESREAYHRAGVAFSVGARATGESYLRFAKTLDPSPLSNPAWWKTGIKRRVPRGVIRRLQRTQSAPDDPLNFGGELSCGQVWGWWPESCSGRSFST